MSTTSQITVEAMQALRQQCLETGEAISKLAERQGLKQSSVSRSMKKFGITVPKVAEIRQWQAEHNTPGAATPAAEQVERESVKRKSKKNDK